jgi:poly(3-hydroxybutyrate) depolymerase
VRHTLPRGEMMHRGKPVDLRAIRRCAILAVEGEKDDISGVGQTLAALELTPNLPSSKKAYHLQKGAGHYGVFNGSRFRAEIVPRIAAFIRTHDQAARRPARAAVSERKQSTSKASAVVPSAARLRASAQPVQLHSALG